MDVVGSSMQGIDRDLEWWKPVSILFHSLCTNVWSWPCYLTTNIQLSIPYCVKWRGQDQGESSKVWSTFFAFVRPWVWSLVPHNHPPFPFEHRSSPEGPQHVRVLIISYHWTWTLISLVQLTRVTPTLPLNPRTNNKCRSWGKIEKM